MKKAVIGVILILILGGCAPKFILPEDTRAVSPRPGIPENLANYLGAWQGDWGAEECRIVVESVEPTKATAVYAWSRFKRP